MVTGERTFAAVTRVEDLVGKTIKGATNDLLWLDDGTVAQYESVYEGGIEFSKWPTEMSLDVHDQLNLGMITREVYDAHIAKRDEQREDSEREYELKRLAELIAKYGIQVGGNLESATEDGESVDE